MICWLNEWGIKLQKSKVIVGRFDFQIRLDIEYGIPAVYDRPREALLYVQSGLRGFPDLYLLRIFTLIVFQFYPGILELY